MGLRLGGGRRWVVGGGGGGGGGFGWRLDPELICIIFLDKKTGGVVRRMGLMALRAGLKR